MSAFNHQVHFTFDIFKLNGFFVGNMSKSSSNFEMKGKQSFEQLSRNHHKIYFTDGFCSTGMIKKKNHRKSQRIGLISSRQFTNNLNPDLICKLQRNLINAAIAHSPRIFEKCCLFMSSCLLQPSRSFSAE